MALQGLTDLCRFGTFPHHDGVSHALPKAVSKLKESGKYDKVFALVERVRSRENISKYLKSDRRQKYCLGIYRKSESFYKAADFVYLARSTRTLPGAQYLIGR